MSQANGQQTGGPAKPEWIQAVLDEFESRLLAYAQRITGCPERAADVVQETFLRLCRQSPADLDGHLGQWLFTVCRNKALDLHRKDQRMTISADLASAATRSGEPAPAEQAEQRDIADRVLSLLSSLPDRQQEVIRLKFQSGLSYREIAGVTGISVTNVGYQLHQALSTLRSQLREQV